MFTKKERDRKFKERQDKQKSYTKRRDKTKQKLETKPMLKKIRVRKWIDTVEIVDRTGKVIEKRDSELDSYKFTRHLVGAIDPKDMPKGLDNFEIMADIHNNLKKAVNDSQEFVILETKTYDFLMNTAFKGLPANLAFNDDIITFVKDWKTAENYEIPKETLKEVEKKESK